MKLFAFFMCLATTGLMIWYNLLLLGTDVPHEAILPSTTITQGKNQTPQAAVEIEDETEKASSARVQTLTRPLFSPTRRPFQKPTMARVQVIKNAVTLPPVSQPPPERPQLLLLGVSSTPEAKLALVQLGTSNEQWVKIGDEIDRWTVASISTDQISLELQGSSQEFDLFEKLESETDSGSQTDAKSSR